MVKKVDGAEEKRGGRVLVVVGYYVPGFRSGGPVRSIQNMLGWIGDRCEFFVFTRDRDSQDEHSYPDIQVDRWVRKDTYWVYYASPSEYAASSVWREAQKREVSAIYLNSFFDKRTIWVLVIRQFRLLLGRKCPRFVIAPRGEFSPGALR